MGFFDKVKDVLTSSDAERARRARRAADEAARAAEEAARRAGDPADSATAEEATAARQTAQEAQREAAEKTVQAEQGAAASTPAGTAATPERDAGSDETATPVRHRTVTVQPGDTLSALAERHGVDWREMATLNGIDHPELIYPGQVFKLPHS